MIIGINLLYLRPGLVGGSEVYVRELIGQLSLLNQHKIVIFCNLEVASTFKKNENLKIVVVSNKPFNQIERLLSENIKLAKFISSNSIDLLFSPANFAIPFLLNNIPQICTVVDLQHLWLKSNFSIMQRLFRSLLFRLSFLRCKKVIAISEFTRRDILKRYNVTPELVSTILLGINDDTLYSEPSYLESVRTKLQLPPKYFYYPAAMFRHKNHITLLKAFAEVIHSENRNVSLILTGAQNDLFPEVMEYIEKANLSKFVFHLGFVTREEVFAIMSMAEGLVFPSEFEGFGLPLLEGMKCGVPVICSDVASIPEVVGDSAILLDPHDVYAWKNAIISILDNDMLREALIKNGYENVKRFSWKRCAERTLETFQMVLDTKKDN